MSRLVTGLFYEPDDAQSAIRKLKASGVPDDAIYLESEVTAPLVHLQFRYCAMFFELYTGVMTPSLFVRALESNEPERLEEALGSPDSFRLRRAQYLLASARGLKPREIAATYGGCEQTVRNVIHAFNATGLDCLTPQSRRPKSANSQLSGQHMERLEHLLHQSPRTFGKPRSAWTLTLLAQVAFEQGLTERQLSHETMRQAILRLGANWKRAKHWITSPDTNYPLKKSGESA